MTKDELGKEIDAYKEKTDLFPHPKIIRKAKKQKKVVKVNPQKER